MTSTQLYKEYKKRFKNTLAQHNLNQLRFHPYSNNNLSILARLNNLMGVKDLYKQARILPTSRYTDK